MLTAWPLANQSREVVEALKREFFELIFLNGIADNFTGQMNSRMRDERSWVQISLQI